MSLGPGSTGTLEEEAQYRTGAASQSCGDECKFRIPLYKRVQGYWVGWRRNFWRRCISPPVLHVREGFSHEGSWIGYFSLNHSAWTPKSPPVSQPVSQESLYKLDGRVILFLCPRNQFCRLHISTGSRFPEQETPSLICMDHFRPTGLLC